MRVKITYTLPNGQGQAAMAGEDIIQWPDVDDEQALQEHVTVYLDQKWGTGQYALLKTEVLS